MDFETLPRMMDFKTLSHWAALPELDCFGKINALLRTNEDFGRDLYRWAGLLELDAVQKWLLREDSWCGDAFHHEIPDGIRFVQETLRRRLKCLRTRRDPRLLIELWRWATERLDVPEYIKAIWDGKEDELKATFVPSSQLAIPEQEKAFANLLRRTADEFTAAGVGHKLKWAVDTLRGLAWERWPEPEKLPVLQGLAWERWREPEKLPVRGASARIVFVWNGNFVRGGDRKPTSLLRPGVLIPLEFRRKVLDRREGEIDWFEPKELFDSDFALAMNSLTQDRGDCFPMSVPEGELPPLPQAILTGDSGKFAVGIPQKLANTWILRRTAHAMPPWVVAAATGEIAASIGLLDRKMEVLLQEGVRVVLLADSQAPPTIPDWANGRLDLLRHGGGYGSAAELLRSKGYTWAADLRHLDLERKRKREELTRRAVIAVILVAVAMPIGGAIFKPGILPTPAIERMRERRAELDNLRRECFSNAKGFDADLDHHLNNQDLIWLAAFCRPVCQRSGLPDPVTLTLDQIPKEANHAEVGLKTLERHVAFDCSKWVPLSSEDEINKVPKEAALSTSIYRFQRTKEGPLTIALELNSGGFGVVPLLEPGDRLELGTKSMKESTRVTKTSYVFRTIPAGGPREFEMVVHSIYFNGFQDQEVRDKDNWCSVRVHPGVREASLALVKPEGRAIASIRKSERIEEEYKDFGVPATLSRAAGEKLPVQDWYVWSIDTDELSKSTVYSMRWKLMPPR